MKIKIGKDKYITEMTEYVPAHEGEYEPSEKCCDICDLWYQDYRVHKGNFLFIKFLVWEKFGKSVIL